MKKVILLFICFLLLSFVVIAQQQRHEITIPDILEYKTLKCDLHMHTVFSDGLVWPTVRVDEAWREGLDAIAITEHVEYQPWKEDVQNDISRSYAIAKPLADAKGILLIKGAEITRAMPPGHFNALFITDWDVLNGPTYKEALQAAKDQDAYIFWNHPGWQQKDEIPIWYKEHSELYHQGKMQGIEIVNERSYYPLAYQWAIDSNLTLIGNSDIHAPMDYDFDIRRGDHRAITLVFAKEKTLESVKEALETGRTAVYYEDMLLGKQEYLEAIFKKSLFYDHDLIPSPGESATVKLYNHSDLPMRFSLTQKPEGVKCPADFKIDPHCSVLYKISVDKDAELPEEFFISYSIGNFLTAPDKGCEVKLVFKRRNN